MAVSDIERRRAIEDATNLALLKNHPSWPLLKKKFEQLKEKHEKVLLAGLVGEQPVNQREIDRFVGFWRGASWILSNPDHAEVALEKALKEVTQTQE